MWNTWDVITVRKRKKKRKMKMKVSEHIQNKTTHNPVRSPMRNPVKNEKRRKEKTYADANAYIFFASVIPPHHVISGCNISQHFFSNN